MNECRREEREREMKSVSEWEGESVRQETDCGTRGAELLCSPAAAAAAAAAADRRD